MVDLPIISFESQEAFEKWLSGHFEDSPIWLRIYKKDSMKATVTAPEALEVCLCYGWIDGQRNKYDAESYLQWYGPRGKKSVWSKINVDHIERLTREGRMQPSGIVVVEAAKADGRWARAYEGQKIAVVPEDFFALLKQHPKAAAFFETLNKVNRYAVIYRLGSAKKEETRQKRMVEFIEKFERGESFYP